ncbi:GTP cyclohydrolase, FolE2/MptA family [Micromonosporaceae bacterium B7E4]
MPTSSSPTMPQARFDDAFYDVPNQRPAVPVALRAVSVRNQQVLLHVRDELVGGTLPLLCDVDVRVSLRAEQRGIHMSRIQTALQTSDGRPLTDLAVEIAERVRASQQQEKVQVRLRARVPLITRTRVSGLSSPDTVEITAGATAGAEPEVRQDLTATNITACPCMQGYALTDLIEQLGVSPERGVDLLRQVPIATHSQRGVVRLGVLASESTRLPGYQHLYQVLAEHTTLTQELLKRPDEYDLVRRAHLAPQFVEDVVRSVASGLVRSLPPEALSRLGVDVTAESYESIHGHDIAARLSAPGHELAHLLAAPGRDA